MAQGTPSPSLFRRALGLLVCAGLVWSIGRSLWYYPHSLSYFNELVGGPEHGHEHLLDSSIAWGQDLLYLKEWYDAHPEARPFYLAYFGRVDPRLAGIEFTLPPLRSAGQAADKGVAPGWYAIDVNYLEGSAAPAPDGAGGRGHTSQKSSGFSYLRRLEPVQRIGWSTNVYHFP